MKKRSNFVKKNRNFFIIIASLLVASIFLVNMFGAQFLTEGIDGSEDNRPPSIIISSPLDQATVAAGSQLEWSCLVTDVNGDDTIKHIKVTFGGIPIYDDDSSPNLSPSGSIYVPSAGGEYLFKVEAWDEHGEDFNDPGGYRSKSYTVFVGSVSPPSITGSLSKTMLTAPANYKISVAISYSALDSDGNIGSVYVNIVSHDFLTDWTGLDALNMQSYEGVPTVSKSVDVTFIPRWKTGTEHLSITFTVKDKDNMVRTDVLSLTIVWTSTQPGGDVEPPGSDADVDPLGELLAPGFELPSSILGITTILFGIRQWREEKE